uniref:Putative odorant binding protein 4 n=1 Tax=Conopomorpha sinensis TaxID=940481 RepID=A0A5Q2UTM3_9NEOP|nr:putative odorant binding protein 4 [Conopomorpha sinensis]
MNVVKNTSNASKMSPASVVFLTTFITYAASMVNTAMSGDEQQVMVKRDAAVMMPMMEQIDMDMVMRDCNETFRIEMYYLSSLNDSGTFPDETDRTPMCFLRCLLEQTEVMSPEGTFDGMRAALVFAKDRQGRDAADLVETATSCTDRQESCTCRKAYAFMKCLVETDLEKHEATIKEAGS